MKPLRIYENFGGEIASTPEAFLRQLGQSSLLNIPGKNRSVSRAVGVLIHGNEPSGINALHAWLREKKTPAVNLICFVGNVDAALTEPLFSRRLLARGRDLNRCFAPPFSDAEGEVAQKAMEEIVKKNPEALIDLHNNTGRNPAYGLGSCTDRAVLGLTSLFSGIYVHNKTRLGSFSEFFDDKIPALTIECGLAGDQVADEIALAGLRRFAEREEGDPSKVKQLTSYLRVNILPEIEFEFHAAYLPSTEMTLKEDLDTLNFRSLEVGTVLGWMAPGARWPFVAREGRGTDVSRDYLAVDSGVIKIKKTLIPMMITTCPVAIKIDCLFYIAH